MKKSSPLITIILMLFVFANNFCKKETQYMDDAIITGSDARACVCCGGLMITFDGETRPYMGDFKLIENGADLGLTDRNIFPVYVKVDWKVDTTHVCNRIIITRMARRIHP